MPIPIEALAQMLSGKGPQSIEDLLAGPVTPVLPLEGRSEGALVDQRVPGVQTKPPLQLRDDPRYGEPAYEKQFPLLPVGDVVQFPPPKPGAFTGPTPMSSDYMVGRRVNPNIPPISSDRQFWEDWVRRTNRKRIEDMGGLRG